MLNRMDHFAMSLVPWFPCSHWWGIIHSHFDPFVSAADFPEAFGCDVHRFFHLCYFLMHNKICQLSFPLMILWIGKYFLVLSHVWCCGLVPEVETVLLDDDPKRVNPPFFSLLVGSYPKKMVSEGGRLWQGKELDLKSNGQRFSL